MDEAKKTKNKWADLPKLLLCQHAELSILIKGPMKKLKKKESKNGQ